MPATLRMSMTMESVQQKKQLYARQLAAYTRRQFNSVHKPDSDPPSRKSPNQASREVERRQGGQHSSPPKSNGHHREDNPPPGSKGKLLCSSVIRRAVTEPVNRSYR